MPIVIPAFLLVFAALLMVVLVRSVAVVEAMRGNDDDE